MVETKTEKEDAMEMVQKLEGDLAKVLDWFEESINLLTVQLNMNHKENFEIKDVLAYVVNRVRRKGGNNAKFE